MDVLMRSDLKEDEATFCPFALKLLEALAEFNRSLTEYNSWDEFMILCLHRLDSIMQGLTTVFDKTVQALMVEEGMSCWTQVVFAVAMQCHVCVSIQTHFELVSKATGWSCLGEVLR